MSKPRLLDLFCGAGGAARGYQLAGFHVTGVDIKPQPNYCGDEFVQADALDFLHGRVPGWRVWPTRFDLIHASPPCQRWVDGMPNPLSHPDLITPMRPLLEAVGLPYVIENVRRAPLVNPIQICGGGLGLVVGNFQLHRHRRFESSLPLFGMPCTRQRPWTITVVGHGTTSGMRKKDRPDPRVADRRKVMGCEWMTRAELSQAIPPAYTQFIGEQLLAQLNRVPAGSQS